MIRSVRRTVRIDVHSAHRVFHALAAFLAIAASAAS
jgi:hypothetical protein